MHNLMASLVLGGIALLFFLIIYRVISGDKK